MAMVVVVERRLVVSGEGVVGRIVGVVWVAPPVEVMMTLNDAADDVILSSAGSSSSLAMAEKKLVKFVNSSPTSGT